MSRTRTHLNTERGCEKAFAFYRQAFGANCAWPSVCYSATLAENLAPVWGASLSCRGW